MIPILILAAGQSSRMGGKDKLLLPVGGQPLLRRVAIRASEVSDDVYIALPKDAAPRLAVIDGLPITPLITPEASEGMSGTMRGAVAQLPECEAFMLLLSDLPDITADDMATVITARAEHPDHLIWRGATTAGKPGHPILFDASLRSAFSTLTGDHGGEAIVRPRKSQTYLVPFTDDRARRDLDTPTDWAAYQRET